MDVLLYIVIGVVVVLVLWLIWTFNRLVKFANRTDEAWSDIDVQLKRRYNLIPNLVETVKGYATHERETLDKVTQARTAAMSAGQSGDPAKSAEAENMLSGTLKTLFAVSENYPDLKANENYLELQRELSDTENKIQASRRFYNGNVRDMNTTAESFPVNLVAGMFGKGSREFFEISNEGERENVKVNF